MGVSYPMCQEMDEFGILLLWYASAFENFDVFSQQSVFQNFLEEIGKGTETTFAVDLMIKG